MGMGQLGKSHLTLRHRYWHMNSDSRLVETQPSQGRRYSTRRDTISIDGILRSAVGTALWPWKQPPIALYPLPSHNRFHLRSL